MGLGVWTVSGRRRVPLPPARRMAFISTDDDSSCQRSALSCQLSGHMGENSSQMNLPNALTIGRIFLVPLLVVVLLTKYERPVVFGVPKELLGAAIFGLASFTDWLDGYLARRRKQVTAL